MIVFYVLSTVPKNSAILVGLHMTSSFVILFEYSCEVNFMLYV